MSAASIVARAVSPTRAATSTRFAAATILKSIPHTASTSTKDSLVCAEPLARDNCSHFRKNARRLEAKMKRTPIRVEPISTYLERRRKGPIYPVIVAVENVFVFGVVALL